MIIKGLDAINKVLHEQHVKNREAYYKRNPPRRKWRYAGPNGSNIVSDHDEDYVFDALFDVPNR